MEPVAVPAPVVRDSNTNNINYSDLRAVELGPGAGALTDVLLPVLGTNGLQCIEIDDRSVSLLQDKHPQLRIVHADVLQVNYPALATSEGGPLSIIGNLTILHHIADIIRLG